VKRILFLCTHNSARSQMAEGWLRHHAAETGLPLEVCSAGTEKTQVKPEALTVMREVGIDLGDQHSKALGELPDPWNFDLVITLCDGANESCPSYPATTKRLHVGFPDPSGESLERWREVRDRLGEMSRRLAGTLARGEAPTAAGITPTEHD